MSKFDELLEVYKSEFTKTLTEPLDEKFLEKVTKGLGPSIYNVDASKVSSSDKKELETVKKNFLIKKLGLEDSPALDEAIDEVVEKLGSSNRNKYRAIVYYLLAKKFNKEEIYN
ncbi:DUF2853 family protein [Wenyingzhuangia sp. 2_MG-2023]|uniref:DUF2853 family protein n=1 Tax=Wenyingzhuangia sp. 2_MG-2023 TaxID=3062639 RepID=UPI0026E1D7D3|nr:DUF2853 family protein [Wenyingzhuangia sp. 2_MG-2023]MDO6736542.1 DUF2853 family protein [Wenyingzhuangia sp. 2_MG-2023]MDO6801163.1 DUF2853 family protein [Wenyingzhuangia sp. 1_MG-2023]